jgi:Zn-finger domain-containing protein
MKTYNATYFYMTKDFANNSFFRHRAQCVIIGETEKRYKIKLIESIYNRRYDEELWVLKKNVMRSYLCNETERCEIYDLTPAVESCRACLQRCDRRYRMLERDAK